MFFLFVNHVKTNERINMELGPYDAKSMVNGHKLHFCFGFHITFPILFMINFHPYIFPPIKMYQYEYNCCYGNVCSYLCFCFKRKLLRYLLFVFILNL